VHQKSIKLEANVWQRVPGTASVEIFPIIAKPSIVSSNCYIFSAPDAIIVIDPGASPAQTLQINQILIDALAVEQRPVLVFLTHCHQDHSQEAGGFALPTGTEIKWFAHEAGVAALSRGDRQLTVAYLYPWHPEVCQVQFNGKLFDSSKGFETEVFVFANGARIELQSEPITMPNGTEIKHQGLPLGAGEYLEFYHTPGHTPCSISLRIGSLLVLGDLPFAANPGLCGLDGWSHADLLETLRKVDWLLETQDFAVCCPGHGHCDSAESMRLKLRLLEHEAQVLTRVDLMNAERIGSLKSYVDELLEEAAALFTILSGRLYTASYYLSLLEEDAAAARILEILDLDQIDRILSEFRRFVEAFNASAVAELTVVLKGVQVARSLQQLLSEQAVQQLLDVSLIGRAQRRLADFLGVVRGLQFLNAEIPGSVNELIEQIVRRVRSAREPQSTDLMEALDDEQSFLAVLSRRLASHSPLRDIELIFTPTDQRTDTVVGADRLDDILTNLIEGMAAIGARQIRISTQALSSQLEIRLSSGQSITPTTFGQRRLDLYNRTLGWLGGSLECGQANGSSEFVLRLPALCLIGST
jgi:glyoxylase-like metal-dependent hydrolase (beta-lactamase superfamily II)